MEVKYLGNLSIYFVFRAVGAIFGDWQGSTTLGFFGDPDIYNNIIIAPEGGYCVGGP